MQEFFSTLPLNPVLNQRILPEHQTRNVIIKWYKIERTHDRAENLVKKRPNSLSRAFDQSMSIDTSHQTWRNNVVAPPHVAEAVSLVKADSFRRHFITTISAERVDARLQMYI